MRWKIQRYHLPRDNGRRVRNSCISLVKTGWNVTYAETKEIYPWL